MTVTYNSTQHLMIRHKYDKHKSFTTWGHDLHTIYSRMIMIYIRMKNTTNSTHYVTKFTQNILPHNGEDILT